jgi:hypothetical protein
MKITLTPVWLAAPCHRGWLSRTIHAGESLEMKGAGVVDPSMSCAAFASIAREYQTCPTQITQHWPTSKFSPLIEILKISKHWAKSHNLGQPCEIYLSQLCTYRGEK